MDLPVTKAWIKARKHDRFYRAAKRQAYRSRAAIKLAQIDDRYGIFREGDVVVDLGAAPGGWSQVAKERVGPRGRVLAVDLVPMAHIEGVDFLRGDFTEAKIEAKLFELLGRPADAVLSDSSPRLSGARSYDVARAFGLAERALSFAVRALRPDGALLVKVFQGDGYEEFLRRVGGKFRRVKGIKPTASARGSAETYILAFGRA